VAQVAVRPKVAEVMAVAAEGADKEERRRRGTETTPAAWPAQAVAEMVATEATRAPVVAQTAVRGLVALVDLLVVATGTERISLGVPGILDLQGISGELTISNVTWKDWLATG
jgi:hypothetical protein